MPSTARLRGLRAWAAGTLLVAAVIVAYWPALHGGFVWDDDAHISKNWALCTPGGLRSIWFTPGATCQYYPLSFTAFWAGYRVWGLNTLGYHLLNVLLHAGAAILLWQLLERLRVRGAWLAGALFALHPVCVMSVAWMTELKNTLSAALMLGAAWAYVRFEGLGVYDRTRGEDAGTAEEPPPWRHYALCLGLFQLALFAKTAVGFLPLTLLLVAWWQNRRIAWRTVWPLLPMAALAMAMGRLTFAMEQFTGAKGEEFSLGLTDRILISGRSFWFYLGKLLAPHRLTFIYERWTVDAGDWRQWAYPASALGLLAGLWSLRRRLGRGPFVALLHFYVTTSMLILLTVLYMTRFSWVSDHWQYYGCMGVMALAGAGITALADRLTARRALFSAVLCAILLAAMGAMTWRQSCMYTDIETLYRTTIERNPGCWLAHNNWGLVLKSQGRFEEAMAHYQEAVRIKPDYAEAHNNWGTTLQSLGRLDEAVAHFHAALRAKPDYAEAHNNWGGALQGLGRLDEAVAHYRESVRLNPNFAVAHYNWGAVLSAQGHYKDAADHFQQALRLKPDLTLARDNLRRMKDLQQQKNTLPE